MEANSKSDSEDFSPLNYVTLKMSLICIIDWFVELVMQFASAL